MKILFAGGGTGGHLIPAINIARLLRSKLENTQFLFVGIKGGMERNIVEKNGFPIEEIEVVGMKRNITGMINFSKKIIRAYIQADSIVRRFNPDVVVGTGGFLSAPVVLAGKRRKAKILIQEQNAYPGLATRFLARFADRICLAFEGSKKHFKKARKTIVTGNPLREDLVVSCDNTLFDEFNLKPGKKVLFITGGSRGAQSLNEAISEFYNNGLLPDDWQILWQTGVDKYEKVIEQFKEIDFPGRMMPFIDSMPKAYAIADLIVCRAGAMTLSEILALGLPAILVPYPYAAADHQMKNALDLKNKGAVDVITDSKLKTDEFTSLLTGLISDDARRHELKEKARAMGSTGAAKAITEEIIKLI
ncbi:MAG: undecaprenyldiphospho-muramoylpentapeptide beta-N-acetylglucosaminyltransferase [candidate division Zixibacteria bacterium]|nr:undecaprenyldiphospho-muramoylpentapeptide beta-N-acetylglucosaminyltransferase [candidate division Zixibacteria bacterium]